MTQSSTMRPQMTVDRRLHAEPSSDPHDRALVRQMLTLTPTERVTSVAAYWPLVRTGLERRRAAGGTRRP